MHLTYLIIFIRVVTSFSVIEELDSTFNVTLLVFCCSPICDSFRKIIMHEMGYLIRNENRNVNAFSIFVSSNPFHAFAKNWTLSETRQKFIMLPKTLNTKFRLTASVILFLSLFCKYKENALSFLGKRRLCMWFISCKKVNSSLALACNGRR